MKGRKGETRIGTILISIQILIIFIIFIFYRPTELEQNSQLTNDFNFGSVQKDSTRSTPTYQITEINLHSLTFKVGVRIQNKDATIECNSLTKEFEVNRFPGFQYLEIGNTRYVCDKGEFSYLVSSNETHPVILTISFNSNAYQYNVKCEMAIDDLESEILCRSSPIYSIHQSDMQNGLTQTFNETIELQYDHDFVISYFFYVTTFSMCENVGFLSFLSFLFIL